MANVKIMLGKDETVEEAKDALFKALNTQRNGDSHTENFSDPAMRNTISRMQEAYRKIYNEMVQEIFEELDREYSDGHY